MLANKTYTEISHLMKKSQIIILKHIYQIVFPQMHGKMHTFPIAKTLVMKSEVNTTKNRCSELAAVRVNMSYINAWNV